MFKLNLTKLDCFFSLWSSALIEQIDNWWVVEHERWSKNYSLITFVEIYDLFCNMKCRSGFFKHRSLKLRNYGGKMTVIHIFGTNLFFRRCRRGIRNFFEDQKEVSKPNSYSNFSKKFLKKRVWTQKTSQIQTFLPQKFQNGT